MKKYLCLIIAFVLIFSAVTTLNIHTEATSLITERSDFIFPDSDTRFLSSAELMPLSKYELSIARNEIYARRGYIFNNAELSEYFSLQWWYTPLYTYTEFSKNVSFNQYEQSNIMLISEVEKIDSQSVSTYDYILPESSTRYYSRAELSVYSKETLGYARNEIYAKHGWIFKSPEYIAYFGQRDWYIPLYTSDEFFSHVALNDYETANVMLCKELELEARDNIVPTNDDYVLSESSTRYYTEAELSGLSKEMLGYARNEIYARNGYIFSDPEYSQYFNSKWWYTPTYTYLEFAANVTFNYYEQANIMLICDLENRTVDRVDFYSYDYIIPESSTRYLTASDLYGLTKEELSLARNEIYARHGYIFNDQTLSSYFNSQWWYVPTYTYAEFANHVRLNNYEESNIAFIMQYEN